MKVTTNHTRTGISVIHDPEHTEDAESGGRKQISAEGVLYDNPEKVLDAYKYETSDPVERQVKKSGEAARRLYKIFIINKIKLQKSDQYQSRVISYISDNLMKHVITNTYHDGSKKSYIYYHTDMDLYRNVKKQKNELKKWMEEGVFKCLSCYNKKFDTNRVDALVDQVVDHAMRNSLRKMIRLPLNQYGFIFDKAGREAYSENIVRAADKNGNLQEKSVDIWLPDVVKKLLHYVFRYSGKSGKDKMEKLLEIELAALIVCIMGLKPSPLGETIR